MNKKVLYISYNGLLESILPSQVTPYLKILSKDGYKFVLLTFEKKKDLEKYTPGELKRIGDELKNYGITWNWLVYHKYPDKISTFFDVITGFFVSLYLAARHRFGIIHVRGVTPGVIALFLPRILGFKFIFDTRGLLAEEYVGGGLWKEAGVFFNLVKAAEKKLFSKTDAVVVLTEKHRSSIADTGYFKDKNISISVIPCCVDMERFGDYSDIRKKDALKKYGITADMLFIYPGKLGTFYLIKEMMDFFECASGKNQNLKFLILTQDDIEVLNKKKISIDSQKAYFIHPLYEEIPVLLNCADAGIFFINPYKKFGSSPIKLGEFLACGKPVIINSGIGDTEELVRDNRVGVVIKDFNKNEYMDKIKELFELLQEGKTLAGRCRAVARKYLSLEMGADSYRRIYSELTK